MSQKLVCGEKTGRTSRDEGGMSIKVLQKDVNNVS